MNFSKAIEDAQKLPELPDDIDGGPIDPFKSVDPMTLISRVMTNEPGQVQDGVRYEYKYHCTRLVIGQVLRGYENGMPIYEDVDEGGDFRAIMNKSLQAKAIIFKKETSFLKDGTVIIWIEWGEPNLPDKKGKPDVLSLSELMSPELPSSEDAAEEEEDSEDIPD